MSLHLTSPQVVITVWHTDPTTLVANGGHRYDAAQGVPGHRHQPHVRGTPSWPSGGTSRNTAALVTITTRTPSGPHRPGRYTYEEAIRVMARYLTDAAKTDVTA